MKGDRPKFRFLLTNYDSGQLSIDFIIGLSIFMVALIMASTMASSLLVGLQSKHIDYDAVAYRTAVMLVEDPGEPVQPVDQSIYTGPPYRQWEFAKPGEIPTIKRFGLAVSKSTPAVISSKKYESFMDSSLYSREDYQNKLLFSDYPYNYNIKIQKEAGTLKTIGDAYHENSQYGYIRRIVLEKESGTIDVKLSDFYFPGEVDGKLTLIIPTSDLLDSPVGSIYNLDPYRESIKIKLDFTGVSPKTDPVSNNPIAVRLEEVSCEYFSKDEENPIVGEGHTLSTSSFIYRFSNNNIFNPPQDLGVYPDFILTEIEAGSLIGRTGSIDKPKILITYDFGSSADISGYEYVADNYPGPKLIPAWMEVRIW